MKKILLALALMLATFAASASNTLYFTYNQALRTVTLLNNQEELMIYCGYQDELPTYVLLNEVWAEQISSSFYEVWLYGYDAYTGEEVYMPIDLECIWLVNNGHIYSAAQTLRFRSSHARPAFAWSIPRYNPFVRAPRPSHFYYTYHYDIHRPGWHWRKHPHIHYHPYYMRPPSKPAPLPPAPFTPGHDKPGYRTATGANGETGYEYIPTNTTGNITASRSQTIVQNDPSSRTGNRITSDRRGGTVTTTDRITGTRSTTAAPSVGRGNQETPTRGNQPATRSTNTRGTSSTGTSTSGRGSQETPSTRSTNSRGTTSTGTSTSGRGNTSATTPRATNTRQSNTSTPATRGTSTATTPSSRTTGTKGTTPTSNTRSGNTSTRGTSTTTRATGNTSTTRGNTEGPTPSRGTSTTGRGANQNRR